MIEYNIQIDSNAVLMTGFHKLAEFSHSCVIRKHIGRINSLQASIVDRIIPPVVKHLRVGFIYRTEVKDRHQLYMRDSQ